MSIDLARDVLVELVVLAIVAGAAYLYRRVLLRGWRRLWRKAEPVITRWLGKAIRFWPEITSSLVHIFLASLLAILVIGRGAFELLPWFLVVTCVSLAVYTIVQEYRFSRKAGYADLIHSLHMVVHNIRDRFDEAQEATEEQFASSLQSVLDGAARAFSIATRTSCRASIKVISANRPVEEIAAMEVEAERVRCLMVKTLARDAGSMRPSTDSQAEYLDENEDFRSVFSDATKRCYFENDLFSRYKKGLYYNSHLPQDFDGTKDGWPLPYASTIVWPIRRVGNSPVHPEHDVLGFLCIDSPSRNVFVQRYDFHAGALVADALYAYIKARLWSPEGKDTP